MTPADFHAAYRDCADQVYAGTGIDSLCLLAQWANETAWGQVVIGFNLGNIEVAPSVFARYDSLDAFAQAAVGVWRQTAFINNEFPHGFEPFRAAAAAADNSDAVLAQIVASPWDSGHYGGSLAAFYTPLEGFELTPQQAADLAQIKAQTNTLYQLLANPGDPRWVALLDGKTYAAPGSGGGGTEPPEPAEPKTISLAINSVPGTAIGTIT